MKKTTLSVILTCAALMLNAQATIWEDDFDSYSPSTSVGEIVDIPAGYAQFDVDGDTYSWGLTQLSNWSTQQQIDFANYYSGNWMISASFVTDQGTNGVLGIGALSPNNILTLPLISIPANATGVNFTFLVGSGSAAGFFAETYDVIITTSNTQGDILAATPVLTSTLAFEGSQTRSIDMNSYAGQDIYISFRHYDTTDEFILGLDDLKIEAETLSLNNVSQNKISYFFNQTTKSLKIEGQSVLNTISVYNVLGQRTLSQKLNDVSAEINMAELQSGIYIVKVDGNNNASKTFKLLVK